ncbi:MAG: heme-binding protein [Pseudomonadota bacterium]
MKKVVLFLAIGIPVFAVILGALWWFMTASVATPDYSITNKDGAIEVRSYPSLRVAEVITQGKRWEAVNAGFSPLARYIFARNRSGEKIAMTAPVTQQRDAGSWSIQFIMPDEYALDDLPTPGNADVSLREIPGMTRAAIRFSGVATDDLIAEKEAALREWLSGKSWSITGEPIYAYYNDPFTPGFLRRNEVLFDLTQ